MKTMIAKILSLGLGMAVVTEEKIKAAVGELVNKGELTQQEARELICELVERGEKNKQEFRTQAEKTVSDLLEKMNIPSRKEVEELKTEIQHLRRELKKEQS